MFFYLLLAFILIPIVEIGLLIRCGQALGVGPTLGLILLTGVIGAALARHQGARTWLRIQESMGRGELPALALFEGLLIFVAGVVLVTPGILTDLFGFALLVPPIRSAVARGVSRHFRGQLIVGPGLHMPGQDASPFTPDDIIDVEYRDVTNERTGRLDGE
jgi:UPF0716 protein FxsA